MADEREITIRISAKNLTEAGFAAARKELAGISDAARKTTTDGESMLSTFKKIGATLGIAYSTRSIVNFAKDLFDAAGQVVDLADQTDLTTETIQRMRFVADQTGTSLEAFTNAAFKLGVNLSGGSHSVRAAVEALRLSYETLRKQSPDQQFETIAGALSKVENAQDRNKLAVDLFGKAAKEILPAIAVGYDEIAARAIIASDAQVRAIEAAGDTVGAFFSGVQGVSTMVLADIITAWGTTLPTIIAKAMEFSGIKEGLSDLSMLSGRFALSVGALPTVIDATRVAVSLLPKPIHDVSSSMDDVDAISVKLTASFKANAMASTELAKAEQARAKALEEGIVWGEGMAGVTADMIEAINELHKKTIDYTDTLVTLSKTPPIKPPIDLPAFTGLLDNITTDLKGVSRWDVAWSGMRIGFKNNLDSIAQTLANAFTGGGNFLGAIKSVASQLGSTLGAGIGFAVGGPLGQTIGKALGSLAGSVAGWIGGLFGGASQKAKEAAEAARKAAEEAAAATKKAIDDAIAAIDKLIDDAKAKIGTLTSEFDGLLAKAAQMGYIFDREGNLVSVSFRKMQDAAKLYGIDLASLGPAFQSARLHDAAMAIINDFTLLTTGGADVGAVLLGMSGNINKLVNDSIKFGTKIPENMRPWIQNLIDAGLLTDANGDKLTNLSEIQFGDPVATELETIQAAMKTLLAQIALLVEKIDELLRDRTITITKVYVDPGPPPGFYGDGGNPPEYAEGTGGRFVDFGSGTPVILHGRERVMTEAEARRPSAVAGLAGSGASVPAGPVNIYIGVDPQSGSLRVLGDHERRQVQNWLSSGQLSVPARAISQRGLA